MTKPVLLLLLSAAAAAPAAAQPEVRVPAVETHRLYSKAVGDSFSVQVLLPPMIPGETTRFPVVYMTDVNHGFIVDPDEFRLMMLTDVPRFIAVGIGYAPSLLQALNIRTRDLTQVPVPMDVASTLGVPFAGQLKSTVTSGGAAQFLAFIRDELMPYIDARYPTDPKERGYWGDSLGGLFGCYVLFNRPETFNRYVIGSPSIWWGGDDILKAAEAYGKTHGDLPADVFIGVGGLEELIPTAKMVTNVLRLERMLRAKNYPSLHLTTRVFPDETHTTVAPMNLIRGLVAVYGVNPPATGLAAKYAEMTKPR